jgi:hypothetical protein
MPRQAYEPGIQRILGTLSPGIQNLEEEAYCSLALRWIHQWENVTLKRVLLTKYKEHYKSKGIPVTGCGGHPGCEALSSHTA